LESKRPFVADSGTLSTTQAYYVFRHFSQFVRPGAKVLTTSNGDAVAFRNPDNSIVAVMYNAGSSKSAYTVQIGAQYVQFSLAATSWATVVLPQ
jgi:glucosylceramidase